MASFLDFGLTELEWVDVDAGIAPLLASPADDGGRGIRIFIGSGGSSAELTGARVWLLWRHRQTHACGAEPFEAMAGEIGVYSVRYPEAMAACEGEVACQVVVQTEEGRLSTRVFAVLVEEDVAGWCGGAEGERFLDVIGRCEDAAADARAAAEELRAAVEAGEFDGAPGADGADGVDGFSPQARVERTEGGAIITVTDGSGTTTAELADGAKGDKGDAFTYEDFTPEQLEALRGPAGADPPDDILRFYGHRVGRLSWPLMITPPGTYEVGELILAVNGSVGKVAQVTVTDRGEQVRFIPMGSTRGAGLFLTDDEELGGDVGSGVAANVVSDKLLTICEDDVVLNLETGCLLKANSPGSTGSYSVSLSYAGRLATCAYVDAAIAAIADLSGEEF